MPDLDITGIDTSTLFQPELVPQKPSNGLDLSGIDTKSLFDTSSVTSTPKKRNPNFGEQFQPTDSNWNLNGISSLDEFYKKTFGTSLPVVVKGQGKIHNKWGLDHRNSADVDLDPNSNEGKQFISYLKENNIPFAAFNGPIAGVATGKHIHVGYLSKKTSSKFQEGEQTQQEEQTSNLNLEGIDTSTLLENQPEQTQVPEKLSEAKASVVGLDLSGIAPDDIAKLNANVDPALATDPLKINFKAADNSRYSPEVIAARGWTQGNKPQIVGKNPNEMGNPITVNSGGYALNSNDVIDLWLNAWNPEYADLNRQYRKETGGLNLVSLDDPKNIIKLNDPKDPYHVRIQARPTREVQSILEAYKANGAAGAVATINLANKERDNFVDEYRVAQQKINEATQEHPYLRDIASTSPALEVLRGGKDITDNPAYQSAVVADMRLANNLKYLSEALYIGATKGYDSPEYQELSDRANADNSSLEETEAFIPRAQTLGQKISQGILSGAIALPKLMAIGNIGRGSLTTLAYLENLHKGNRAAALAALPMAVMEGGMQGFREALSANEGAGNSAFLYRVPKEDLSLLQDNLVKGTNLTIKQLTPFQRQLVLRGANALTLAGTSFITNPHQDLTDTISNLTIGASFGVGESPKEVRFPSLETGEINNSAINSPLQLEPARVNLPLEPTTLLGGDSRDIATTYLPSGESPTNKYKERTYSALTVNNLEKGFEAKQEGAIIHLPIDDAALHYLELERALKTNSFKNAGDNISTVLEKQQAIKVAMETLKKGIPNEVLDFFRKNEDAVRTSIKGNYELNQAKNTLIQKKAEALKLTDVKPINEEPNGIKTGEEPASEILGNIGKENLFTNQQNAHDILKNFFKITKSKQGTFSGTLVPYGDVIVKKSADAAYLGAFFIEDFYHRGIEPTVDLVLNKLRTTLGDYGKFITDEQAKIIFQKGKEYYNSNVADPFFSKMKQDATEKLPNRFTAQQAQQILTQHVNEFGWTAGLEDFLRENDGKKINKQDLVNVIQRGQVRVETSINAERNLAAEHEVQNRIDQLELQENKIREELFKSGNYKLQTELNEVVGNDPRLLELSKKHQELIDEKNNLLVAPLQYSLKAYSGEKLELPGAKNSKEVKLISILPQQENLVDWERQKQLDATNLVGIPQEYTYAWKNSNTKQIVFSGSAEIPPIDYNSKAQYNSPHWNEPNVVAHYRSTDRTTIDNIPIYFSEEFQSDWNHDIRDRGLKVIKSNDLTYSQQEIDSINRTRIEPNPFIQHLWKELVFKRFLRDAVVAKDENGNNKYEGIGWTTARQQKERYGKILEGKDFDWIKNRDDSYSFRIKKDEQGYQQYHELENISLERFAELTTKEAAQEVRDQEANIAERRKRSNIPAEDNRTFPISEPAFNYNGKFSLKEAVELRSGIGKYSDYDEAMVNYAKKIGKRFGASYSEKELLLQSDKEQLLDENLPPFMRKDKIHYLEITPSMRESLSKEGFPLYGTGGNEKLKSPEVGIRNKITTQQGFDEHRNNLIESIINDSNSSNENNAFNSGLSPDALIDSLKLTWSDAKNFLDFSKELIGRFGDTIRPYLENLWIQVKGFTNEINNRVDALHDYISQGPNSFYFLERQIKEGGFVNLNSILKPKTIGEQAEAAYKKSRRSIPYFEWYSFWRGVGLAQLSIEFGKVYDVMRGGQRVRNSMESSIVRHLSEANKLLKTNNEQAVADNIWIGNENKRLWTDAELAAGDAALNRPALNVEEIQAYKAVRAAIDINLDIRRETKLYSMREKANRLNKQLIAATPGTPLHDSLLTRLLDLDKSITGVKTHFQELKDSGYISTQRRGPIAVYAEDPAFPVGDVKRKLYNHFDSAKEAQEWLDEMHSKFGAIINSDTAISDIRKPENLRRAAANLTPGQFEDLIDSAGVNSKDPEIEKLRDEIYSRFPSFGYELKRDFTRGYYRNWQFALESIAHQTETYASSFYSRVAGEEAMKKLDSLGLQASPKKSMLNIYKIAQKYIDHEISAPEYSSLSKAFGGVRKGIYLFQLGFDINQLYLNALAQPITQTYSYFSRVTHEGIGLTGLEPEKYFNDAGNLTARLGKEYLQQKIDPTYIDAKIPQELRDILDRLKSERVIEPEFNRSLLEMETEKTVQAKIKTKSAFQRYEHWAGVFMRGGEKTTRTHVATEAYLVGKEKFNLSGEDLTDFIVRAVDATQSNPTRAEAPLAVRGAQNTGEIRKLLYQFNAFNHMWLENLALNVKADFENRGIKNTARHLYPLVLMGGVKGLPLAGFSTVLYTLITGDDPKKHFDKLLGKDSTLERVALYGLTTSPALSNRLTPSIPFLDQIKVGNSLQSTASDTLSTTNIPAVATAGQITRGFSDLLSGQKLRGIGEAFPIKPIRTISTAIRYAREGVRTRANKTLVPKSKLSNYQTFGQGIGLVPAPVLENYDNVRTENLQNIHRNTISPLVRKVKRIL